MISEICRSTDPPVIAPEGQLRTVVERTCEQILLGSPVAICASKEAAMRGLNEQSIEAAIKAQADYPGFKAWLTGEDRQEGQRAFAEKRAPIWQGR